MMLLYKAWRESRTRFLLSALALAGMCGLFVYFHNEGHPGTVIEMSHATPTRRHIFDAVREAAVGWDGRDPIRTGWPT